MTFIVCFPLCHCQPLPTAILQAASRRIPSSEKVEFQCTSSFVPGKLKGVLEGKKEGKVAKKIGFSGLCLVMSK